MDYCSACRRHLNGALVCPGCGAYAPDIAPSIVLTPADTMDVTPGGAAFANAAAAGPGDLPAGPGDPADVDPAPGADVPEGRAARRRQRARWRKNQRRAVVATAFALLGGGMTAAALERDTSGRALAASAPEDLPDTSPDERTPAHEPAPTTPPPSPAAPPASADDSAEHRATPPPKAPKRAGTGAQRAEAPAAPRASVPRTLPLVPADGRPSVAPTEPSAAPAPATRPTETAPAPATDPATSPDAPTTGTQPAPTEQPARQELCLLVICLG
ncbi:SCO2400 family protein [Streptomyces tritici]|uniref:SCO2400 family protein n=1 Tax=Streptomyces tritici TaxID=2054410 RepID=UPI003AF03894